MEILQPSWAWTPEGVLHEPYIEIDAGRILRCSTEARQPPPGVWITQLPGRFVLPGLVNAHSHAFQRAFRGHVQFAGPGADDFWGWRRAMYGVAHRLDPDGVFAVSRLAFLEMLLGGVTAVGEFHYLHHQPDGSPYADPDELALAVASAAADVGLRLVLLRVAYGRGGVGAPLSAEQRRFACTSPEEALEATLRLHERSNGAFAVGLAPHSVRAIPPTWWTTFASFPGPIHAHVAEQPREVAACHAETGVGPLRLLHQNGVLASRFTAVHLTHPDPGDADLLEEAGATVCVCPSTEMDLGDGFLPDVVRRRARLAVGSDSHARIDLFAEMRDLEMHGRGVARRRLILGQEPGACAGEVLRAATLGGARSLGLDGGLSPGSPADLCAVDLRRPAATGVPPLEAVAWNADASWVSDVWVGGRRLVVDGVAAHVDTIVRAARPHLGPG